MIFCQIGSSYFCWFLNFMHLIDFTYLEIRSMLAFGDAVGDGVKAETTTVRQRISVYHQTPNLSSTAYVT